MNSPGEIRDVKQVIRALVSERGQVSNAEVRAALASQISRQAVHQHLQALVATGELEPVGSGRTVRYRRRTSKPAIYQTDGLEEHVVWSELMGTVAAVRDLPPTAQSTARYVFTEMLNNVIDHSGSGTAMVTVNQDGDSVQFAVEDSGVGIFRKVARALGSTTTEAAQRLMLGRFTTAPEHHTGEGIFFSSRLANIFIIESDGLRWTVDNQRGDWSLGQVFTAAGTKVRFDIDRQDPTALTEVFERFTDPQTLTFDRTHAVIKMLEAGVRFVSRSEAKRLAAGLEAFTHVTLDFAGVAEVGQGFVDELFRVWARAHPHITLEPVNMNEPVAFMVGRGTRD